MKQAEIFMHDKFAGMLAEDENGFTFQYDSDYLNNTDSEAISLTIPFKRRAYHIKIKYYFLFLID